MEEKIEVYNNEVMYVGKAGATSPDILLIYRDGEDYTYIGGKRKAIFDNFDRVLDEDYMPEGVEFIYHCKEYKIPEGFDRRFFYECVFNEKLSNLEASWSSLANEYYEKKKVLEKHGYEVSE